MARLPDDSGVVFVPDTAPGDRIRVQVPSRGGGKRGWVRGRVAERLEDGPHRQPPPCPVADTCGGCQWQHVQYATQLDAKQQILKRSLRQARLDIHPEAAAAAPAPLGYRCRARLSFAPGPDGPRLGFRARRSHDLVDLESCPVLLPALSEQLPMLRRRLPDGAAGELRLLGNEAGDLAAVISDNHGRVTPLTDRPRVNLARPDSPPFWGSPAGFVQANLAMNRQLRRGLRAWAAPVDGPVVELYAGAGNLTRELATMGPVTAVESDAAAIRLGRANLGDADVTWVHADVDAWLGGAPPPTPALVVLDPPRTGARDANHGLARLGAPRILYVSCDPMTLARDARHLSEHGYALARLGLLDTMPQTAHFECVAEFRHH